MTTYVVGTFRVTWNTLLFFELETLTSHFVSRIHWFSNPQSFLTCFLMAIFLSFSSYQRLCHLIRKVSIGLFIFLILGKHTVSLKRFKWLYMEARTDSVRSVRCKILGSVNKADNLCVIITVWACLAFQKCATYTHFDTKMLWGQPTGKKRLPDPDRYEWVVPPKAWGCHRVCSISKGPGNDIIFLGPSEQTMVPHQV